MIKIVKVGSALTNGAGSKGKFANNQSVSNVQDFSKEKIDRLYCSVGENGAGSKGVFKTAEHKAFLQNGVDK